MTWNSLLWNNVSWFNKTGSIYAEILPSSCTDVEMDALALWPGLGLPYPHLGLAAEGDASRQWWLEEQLFLASSNFSQAQATALPWRHLHLRQNFLPVFPRHFCSVAPQATLTSSFGSRVCARRLGSVSREWLCVPVFEVTECLEALRFMCSSLIRPVLCILVWEKCSFQKHFVWFEQM